MMPMPDTARGTVYPSPTQDQMLQYVVLYLNGQQYCVDIMSVREIRVVQTITGLPGANAFVRGVINLRGNIVPVFDLRKRFGLGDTCITQNQAVIIAIVQDQLTALLVDEVLDIISVPRSALAGLPAADAGGPNPLFKGLVTLADEMRIVIDLDMLGSTSVGEPLGVSSLP